MLYFASTVLLSFDGEQWRKTPLRDSYLVRKLSFSPDGRLWAGLMGDLGWFERNANQEWTFHSLLAHLPVDQRNVGEIMGVSADAKGTTFVGMDRVFRWDGQQLITWIKKSDKRLFSPRTKDALYIHHLESGLFQVGEFGLRPLISNTILENAMVLWLEHHDSEWLLGTSKGFFSYDGKILTKFAPQIDDFLREGTLSCASRLPDGRIAVGTLNRGIAFLRADGTLESLYGPDEGIPSPLIYSLFVDKDGDLWATTSSHLLRIDLRGRSTIFDTRAGLPRQTYRRITKSLDAIYVANESGVLVLPLAENRFASIEQLSGRWNHILGTSHGLVVSGFRGSLGWNGTGSFEIHRNNFDERAAAVSRDDSEALLIADHSSIGRRTRDGNWRPLVHKLSSVPTSLAEDTLGRIWIGTLAGGFFVATPSNDLKPVATVADAEDFGLPPLLGPTYVRTNPSGSIMVFANNGAWLKPASTDDFSPVAEFPARGIAAVSQLSAAGTVWVAHEHTNHRAPTIGRVSITEGRAKWEPHSVDGLLEVGAPRSIFAEAAASDETNLWIGGTHALLRHTVGKNLSVVRPRPPLLRAFTRATTDGDRQPIAGALRYASDQIEFEFAAPEFSRRSLLRIETRINGIDNDWVPLDSTSHRELTAIRDGRYTVRARVVAETGAISPETVFSFIVLPPYWRTPPFLIAAGVILLPIGYGAYLLRVRALRRRNAELEQKVRERTEELVAANAAKTQFVANMSHDIRNPLNGIVGLAIALEDTRLQPRQREIVATLRECTTYLSSLVDDVLDFASIEAGRVELRPRAYSAPELLRSIVETLKADATSSGAVLTVEADPRLPQNLLGDAGRIQQILVNFVSNALKYAGGNIQLSAYAPSQLPGEIEFAVTDHGPGISAEEQATLFTKFTRLRQKHGEEEIPGNGLGLASCRLLADIMGGSVGLQSQPGKGSRFTLRLPLMIPSEPDVVPATSLPNTTVLLVEDTDYNAWAASAVLSRLGLTCERARTGAEALQRFGEKRFNVVLLDRNLPDMDGTEVARRMREMESDGLQAVVLAVTAYCTAEDRELCLKSGMDAFVGKPLTPEKLRRVLIAAGRRLLASASVQALREIPTVEIDTSLLSYLSDGSPEGLRTQCNQFIATLDQFEAELNAAVGENDSARVRVAAHRLLGQAKMIGAEALGESALAMETAATANDIAACRNLLPRAHAEIISITEAMSRPRPASRSA